MFFIQCIFLCLRLFNVVENPQYSLLPVVTCLTARPARRVYKWTQKAVLDHCARSVFSVGVFFLTSRWKNATSCCSFSWRRKVLISFTPEPFTATLSWSGCVRSHEVSHAQTWKGLRYEYFDSDSARERNDYIVIVFQVKPQRNPNGIIQVEYSLFSPSTDVSASRVLWCFLRTADGHHDTSVFMDGQEFWFVNQPRLSYEEASIYCSSNKSKLATPQTFNAARHLHEHLYKVWVVPSATSSPTQRGIQRF